MPRQTKKSSTIKKTAGNSKQAASINSEPRKKLQPRKKIEPALKTKGSKKFGKKSANDKKTTAQKPRVKASRLARAVQKIPIPTITEEMISERAHQIWIEEGRPEGRSQAHWEQAEKELRG